MSHRSKHPFLVIAAALAVAAVVAAVALAFFFPSAWARRIVVTRLEAALRRPVAVESAHVRLFPRARIELTGLSVGDTLTAGVPRITARSVKLGCRWVPLLRREVQVTDLLLDAPAVEMTLAPPGASKPPASAGAAAGAPSPFGLLLEKISIRNASVLVRDPGRKPFFEMHRASADLAARIGRARDADLEAKAEIPEMLLHLPGGAVGKGLPVRLEGTMHYDTVRDALTLNSTTIDLAGVPIALKGEAGALRGISPVVDISLHGGPAQVSRLAGFLPAALFEKAEGIESQGILEVDGTVSGPLKQPGGPDFSVLLSLREGLVRVRGKGQEVRNIALTLKATRDSIDIRDLTAEAGSSRLKARGILTGYPRSPFMTAAADADLDLRDIAPFLEESARSLTGRVQARIVADGPPNDPERIETTGEITLDNVGSLVPNVPVPLTAARGLLVLDRRTLSIHDVSARLGSSDLTVRGTLTNFLALDPLHPGAGRASGDLRVTSTNLNVDELAPPPGKAGAGGNVAPSPLRSFPPLDGSIYLRADKMLVHEIPLEAFEGTGILENGLITLQGVGFHTFGGIMMVAGTIDLAHPESPQAALEATFRNVEAAQIIEHNPKFDRYGGLAGAITGKLSGRAQIKGPLDSTLAVVPEKLTSSGTLRIDAGSLKNLPLQKTVAEFLDQPQLTSLDIDEWVQPFHIENGKLFVQELGIKAAGLEAIANGWQSLDGTLELHTDLWLPPEASARVRSKLPADIAAILLGDPGSRVLVPLVLSGKAKSPSIALDATRLTSEARSRAAQRLDAERKRLEEEARNAALEAARRAAGASHDTTPLDQQAIKDKVKKEVEDRLKHIFNR